MKTALKDTDTLNYNPLSQGKVPDSSPRVRRMPQDSGNPKDSFFLFDEHFAAYREVKLAGRAERIGKYYRRMNEDLNMKAVIDKLLSILAKTPGFEVLECKGDTRLFHSRTGDCLILDSQRNLLKSYKVSNVPGGGYIFDEPPVEYLDAFDAIAMQLQCDLVLMTVRPDGISYASMISLFFPNGWDAEWAIGKSFSEIHSDVKNRSGALIVPNGESYVAGLTRMPGYVERVGAISWRTDTRLNRHPDTFAKEPAEVEGNIKVPSPWDFELGGESDVFLRFERQTVTGVPEASSFLFSIHTIFNRLADDNRYEGAVSALTNKADESYHFEAVAKDGARMASLILETRRLEGKDLGPHKDLILTHDSELLGSTSGGEGV
jgi:hypothetical protein